jgi:hypothetical protein
MPEQRILLLLIGSSGLRDTTQQVALDFQSLICGKFDVSSVDPCSLEDIDVSPDKPGRR